MKIVTIVGRPNVGKSSLFNYLIGKKEAKVKDEEGTTLDLRSKIFNNVKLFDTPGTFENIEIFKKKADLVLLVTEHNITEYDKKLYLELKKYNENVFVVVNKIDKGEDDYSFFENYIKISLKARIGLLQIKALLNEFMQEDEEIKKKTWAIIGRPNVGKSSIINKLIKEDLHRISNEEGTTKEFLPVDLADNILLDTPGTRQKRYFPHYENIFGVIVVFDLNHTKQDLSFIGEIMRRKKPVIVVLNKVDLLENEIVKRVEKNILRIFNLNLIKFSCFKNYSIELIFSKIKQVEEGCARRISTSKLNTWLQKNVKNLEPKLKFISQIQTNFPKFFCDYELTPDKEKMLKKMLANEFGFEGVPMDIKYKN